MSIHPFEAKVRALLADARSSGSQQSLAELLEFYRPRLVRLSQRKVARGMNGKVSSSEVTQEAIISATQSFEDFRGETIEEFYRWLSRILENLITDQTRRFLAGCRDASRETTLSNDIEQTATQRPSQICSTREQVMRLLKIVEELPLELRTIVRLRYQQDLHFTEIGSFLGLSPARVKRRWDEAVKHIERAMA